MVDIPIGLGGVFQTIPMTIERLSIVINDTRYRSFWKILSGKLVFFYENLFLLAVLNISNYGQL